MVLRQAVLRRWALVFILLVACPFTAPFSSFDVVGPHGVPASDTHTGVAAATFAIDGPGLIAAPILLATRPDVFVARIHRVADVRRLSEPRVPPVVLRI